MINFRRIWVVAALLINAVFPQVEVDNFGEVMVQVNDRPAQKYYIGGVDLYKNVSIDYDTTLQVQEKDATVFYYYPQLNAGEHYVLHMILNSSKEEEAAPYDFYVDLGKSIDGEIVINAADSNLFITPNGRFTRSRPYARDHNGSYRIASDPLSGAVNGAIRATFEYPAPGDGTVEHFSMEGSFKIPTQNVQEGDATNIATSEKKDSVFRNLAYAALGSVVIVLLVLQL